jgi:CheY-like chemotaxis protein
MAEVLVVDDDPDIRMLVAFALEDSGYTVRQAPDGEAALVAVEQVSERRSLLCDGGHWATPFPIVDTIYNCR